MTGTLLCPIHHVNWSQLPLNHIQKSLLRNVYAIKIRIIQWMFFSKAYTWKVHKHTAPASFLENENSYSIHDITTKVAHTKGLAEESQRKGRFTDLDSFKGTNKVKETPRPERTKGKNRVPELKGTLGRCYLYTDSSQMVAHRAAALAPCGNLLDRWILSSCYRSTESETLGSDICHLRWNGLPDDSNTH